MKVEYKNNTLTVITEITEESVKNGVSDLTARDEKGNMQYVVVQAKGTVGSLDKNGMVVNTFIDGKAAVVIVAPIGTEQKDIARQYGEALIVAEKYTASIAAAAVSKTEKINSFFQA